MRKKPNRRPNLVCKICGKPFYGAPAQRRVTCSFDCRNVYYREIGNLLTGPPSGPRNPNWKGGRCLLKGEYWLLLCPDHPYADRHGYVREHRLVMEEHLGRYLDPSEVVHHINGDSLDNRLENLRLYSSHSDHWVTEHLEDIQKANPHMRCYEGPYQNGNES